MTIFSSFSLRAKARNNLIKKNKVRFFLIFLNILTSPHIQAAQINTKITDQSATDIIKTRAICNPFVQKFKNVDINKDFSVKKILNPNPTLIGLNLFLYSSLSVPSDAALIGISTTFYCIFNKTIDEPPKINKNEFYHPSDFKFSINQFFEPNPLFIGFNISMYASASVVFDTPLIGMVISFYTSDLTNEKHEKIKAPKTKNPTLSISKDPIGYKTGKIHEPNPVWIGLNIAMFSSVSQAIDQTILGIGVSLYSIDVLSPLDSPVKHHKLLFKRETEKKVFEFPSHPLEQIIDCYIANKNYFRALDLINSELRFNPCDNFLLTKKAEVYIGKTHFRRAEKILNCVENVSEPNEKLSEKVKKLRGTIKEKYEDEKENPKNEVGILYDPQYISDLRNYWKYSRAHYYRTTDIGKFGVSLNSGRRVINSGTQYMLEAYPKFRDNLYGSFIFGLASARQIVYPNFMYRVEGFYNIKEWNTTVSLGQGRSNYAVFSNQKIYLYTTSVDHYIEKCRSHLLFRASGFRPNTLLYYEFGYKQILSKNDENTFINIKFGNGEIPDIGDLPPFDKILIVKQTAFNVDVQYAFNRYLFLKLGCGYTHMQYPKVLRAVTDGWAGLVIRY
jgi:YaiO family outer membrane protein